MQGDTDVQSDRECPAPKSAMVHIRQRHRIAMVCDFFYPRLGGVENHIYSLSQHLIRLGHKVVVITHAYDDRKGVRYLPGPLKVYYCPILPMTDQDALPTFTATLPLLRSIFIRERIQIVHAHQATSTMANESIVYASMLGLATVYTDHSLFAFDDLASVILNRVLQTTLSTVDAAICVSHVCRDNLILRARLDPQRVVAVIPNAVDPSKFTPLSHNNPPQPNGRRRDRYVSALFVRSFVRPSFASYTTLTPFCCSIHIDVVVVVFVRVCVCTIIRIHYFYSFYIASPLWSFPAWSIARAWICWWPSCRTCVGPCPRWILSLAETAPNCCMCKK